MKVSGLQEKVTIQVKSTATDSAGGRTVSSWATHAAGIWADITESGETEGLDSDQTQNPTKYRVKIRNSSDVVDITPAMRILRADTTRVMYIHKISPSKRLENKLTLECRQMPFVAAS